MLDIHRSAYEGSSSSFVNWLFSFQLFWNIPLTTNGTIAGQDQLVAAALAEDPSRINTPDADGRTPLHNACSSGSMSVVRVRTYLIGQM